MKHIEQNVNTSRLRILVAGHIVGGPLGGLVWHHLQYVIGLFKMGHDVLFVEESGDAPFCYDPGTDTISEDPSYGLDFIRKVFREHGLADLWAYHYAPGNRWYGKTAKEVDDFIGSADLFINLSGIHPVGENFLSIPVRAYVDTDPVFTQARNLTEPERMQHALLHNRFLTFGENFGTQECSTPDDGLPWKSTRQPVVMDIWKFSEIRPAGRWTTVMQWDSYKVREYRGRRFGMKSASFDAFCAMPVSIADELELALSATQPVRERLSKLGWKLVSALETTRTPASYQEYIASSKGEWSIAKEGYVVSARKLSILNGNIDKYKYILMCFGDF